MPLEMTLPCASCGLRNQISTMKYSLNGNRLLCHGCAEEEQAQQMRTAAPNRNIYIQ